VWKELHAPGTKAVQHFDLGDYPAGRGLGTRVAAAAGDLAVQMFGICRYRALETSGASLRIAEKLGFTPYGRNLVFKQA
jgi:RimJ/RimL family protein N-acetyltransferase